MDCYFMRIRIKQAVYALCLSPSRHFPVLSPNREPGRNKKTDRDFLCWRCKGRCKEGGKSQSRELGEKHFVQNEPVVSANNGR